MPDVKHNIAINIKKYRKLSNITQRAFSKLLGVAPNTVSEWEKGKYLPDANTLCKICDIFKVTLAQLYGDDIVKASGLSGDGINSIHDEFIKKYRSLDRHGLEAVNALIEIEYKRIQKLAAQPKPDEAPQIIHLPIPELPASAGCGIDIIENETEYVDVPLSEVTRRADMAIRVRGESMAPKFHDGDILLIREQPAVDEGELGIFILNEMGYFKKLGNQELISLSPDYENIPIGPEDELRCIGKVLGKL